MPNLQNSKNAKKHEAGQHCRFLEKKPQVKIVPSSYLSTPLDNLWMRQLKCIIDLVLLLESKSMCFEAFSGSFCSCVDALQARSRAHSPGGKRQASPAAPWSSWLQFWGSRKWSEHIFCYCLLRGPLTHIHSVSCQPQIRTLKTSPGNLPYGTVSQDQCLFYSGILSWVRMMLLFPTLILAIC